MASTLVLGAAYFYVMSNITMIVTILPFIAQDIYMSQLQITLLIAIFPLISLPANLLIGPVADVLGRKRFLVIGSVACAILFAMASAITNAWEAIVLRGITAVFMSMIGSSVFSSIPDYFTPARTITVTGYVSAAASLAQLAGIPLILLFAETAGWRSSFLALAVYAGLLSLMIIGLPAPEYAAAPTERHSFRSHVSQTFSVFGTRAVRLPLTGYALCSSGMFVFLALYPTWLLKQQFNIETGPSISLIFFCGGLGSLAGALFTGLLGPKFGSARKTCSILAALTAISIAIVPFTGPIAAAQIAAFCLACTCRAVFVPIIFNGTMSVVGPHQRGSANGILAAIFQASTALGGVIGAQLYAADTTFLANAAVASAFFVASIIVFAKAY